MTNRLNTSVAVEWPIKPPDEPRAKNYLLALLMFDSMLGLADKLWDHKYISKANSLWYRLNQMVHSCSWFYPQDLDCSIWTTFVLLLLSFRPLPTVKS